VHTAGQETAEDFEKQIKTAKNQIQILRDENRKLKNQLQLREHGEKQKEFKITREIIVKENELKG